MAIVPILTLHGRNFSTVTEDDEMVDPTDYTRFVQLWICPAAGSYTFDMILHIDDGDENIDSTMVDSTIACQNAGDTLNLSFDGIAFEEDANSSADSDEDSSDSGTSSPKEDSSPPKHTSISETSSGSGCNISPFKKSNSILRLLEFLF